MGPASPASCLKAAPWGVGLPGKVLHCNLHTPKERLPSFQEAFLQRPHPFRFCARCPIYRLSGTQLGKSGSVGGWAQIVRAAGWRGLGCCAYAQEWKKEAHTPGLSHHRPWPWLYLDQPLSTLHFSCRIYVPALPLPTDLALSAHSHEFFFPVTLIY